MPSLLASCRVKPNYAIKPTPELALRSNRTLLPARLIAALAIIGLEAIKLSGV
jgi:hypothetical protein